MFDSSLSNPDIISACTTLSSIEPNDEYFLTAQNAILSSALQQVSICNRPKHETFSQHLARLDLCARILTHLQDKKFLTETSIPSDASALSEIIKDTRIRRLEKKTNNEIKFQHDLPHSAYALYINNKEPKTGAVDDNGLRPLVKARI